MTVVCSLKELNHLIKEKTAQVDKTSEPHIKLALLIELENLWSTKLHRLRVKNVNEELKKIPSLQPLYFSTASSRNTSTGTPSTTAPSPRSHPPDPPPVSPLSDDEKDEESLTSSPKALSPTPHNQGDTDTPVANPGCPPKQSTPLVIVRKPPAGHQAVSTTSTSSSSSSSAMAAAQNGVNRDSPPNSSAFDNIHCTHPQVNGYILYKNLKELNLPGPREPGGAYLPKSFMPGHNFCYRCGFWYKKRHNISVCDTKRGPRLRGVVSFAHGALNNDQGQDTGFEASESLPHPESWDFQSFTGVDPQEIFCYPNTLQEIPLTVTESLSKLVCDVCGAVKYKKPGAFQVLLLLPRLITPHTAKKKWAARCITANIHLFREGRWDTLLEKPPNLKPLIVFNKYRRALS